MTAFISPASKRRVKGYLKRLRADYVRYRYAFGASELKQLIQRLGLASGHIVLVHSSMDSFEAFRGSATDIIRILQEVVGPGGTILMPTLPFTGTAVAYAKANPVFDVAGTPSRVGLVTELFRRSPGVRRSIHPTHAVAAWGARCEELLADHHLATTPCGHGTPYWRLTECDGKMLFLGTDIEVMTFFHAIEEELEPGMPFSPFTREMYTLSSRAPHGTLLTTTTRLFDPSVSRRRTLAPLAEYLRRNGRWSEGRVGNLRAILLSAPQVFDAARKLAAKGEYCYAR